MHVAVDDYTDIREAVSKLCQRFPGEYWRKIDREMAYPNEFVNALTEAGWLSILIPEEYGGAGCRYRRQQPYWKKYKNRAAMAVHVTPRCTRWAPS